MTQEDSSDPKQNINTSLPNRLKRTLWAFRAVLERELNVNILAVRILLSLDQQDGLSQNYLSGCLQVDASLITRMVKEMENLHGWIRRERDPSDNRLMRVYLTDSGRVQFNVLHERMVAVERRLTRNLTAEQLEALRHALLVLEETARNDYEDLLHEKPSL